VRLLAVGMDLAIRSRRYEHVPWQAYDALPHQLARMDVALAPLVDDPFNTTRSNVKLKDYAAAGAPWLASPVGEYAWMGASEGGRLVADGEWRTALEELIRDEDARLRLSIAGRRWAAGEVVVDHVEQLEALLERAMSVRAHAA
jgi:glycosyltransferase involved in cell wall biosynthesis